MSSLPLAETPKAGRRRAACPIVQAARGNGHPPSLALHTDSVVAAGVEELSQTQELGEVDVPILRVVVAAMGNVALAAFAGLWTSA